MPSIALKPPFQFALRTHVVESVSSYDPRVPQQAIYWGIMVAATAMSVIAALALRGNRMTAEGIDYFCYSIALLVSLGVCAAFIRRKQGMTRVRWILLAGSCLCQLTNFLLAGADLMGWVYFGYARFLGSGVASVGEALLLLAAATFYSRVCRSMVMLDLAQALLFSLLHFALRFGPKEADLFQQHHLTVTTASYGFYFLAALAAYRGASSQPEARFLRLLSIYLGLQLVGIFLMNQISYEWLNNKHASIWSVPYIPLTMAFALVAIRAYNRPVPAIQEARPTLFMRNLMPSFLALGNLTLGLVVMRFYPSAGVSAIFFAVVCYVLRAGLVQGESGQERERLSEANRRLEQLATHDPLTGAGNRRSLVSAILGLPRLRELEKFSLILVDADWFKQANDHHGHLYGDRVLVAIADVLRVASETIPNGHCARLGGDEFAMLLPNFDSDAALHFAEDVRLRVNSLGLRAGERTISISVGATVSTLSGEVTFENLMSRADEALYLAKSLGRNRVEILA